MWVLIGAALMVYAGFGVIKIFNEDYKIRSKSNSRAEYVESSRFSKPIMTRISKPSLSIEGIRNTSKEQKSKSLIRYDVIRTNTIFNRD